MSKVHLGWPGTTSASLLAALTTWIALWAWAGFVERPSGFLVPLFGVGLLVAATGMLLRSARVPSLLTALGQAGVVALWLHHRWAEDLALGGWIPTDESMARFGEVLRDSVTAAQSYAAPVSASVPEIYPLLIVTGAAAVVLVDFIACGLRRVPVAGLPLLAVYTAPASILDGGVPWWGFVAGAMSFLFLLAGDEGRRLSHWGRQISQSDRVFDTLGTRVSTETVRASARKIGLTATGLAVLVPIFVPTFSGTLFDGSGPGGDGDGDAVAIDNPMADLKRDLVRGRDVDVLDVYTVTGDPTYLRVSVLDSFDGETWKPSDREIPAEQRAEGRLPRPPGLSSGVTRREVTFQIRARDTFDSQWLPAPYPVSSIEARGDWRYDTDTFDFISAAEGQSTVGLEYDLSALQVEALASTLSSSGPSPENIFTPYTDLPDNLSDRVPRLAREVTAGATSRFEKAVRLQDWFREDGGFRYSLTERGPGNSTDDLLDFLSPDGRVGYCEQFAASMAVMGRSLGIPSRVVVGFLRPDKVEEGHYVYSAHDLHAWPEMYFDGTGWLRFEPTPQDRARSVPSYTNAQLGVDPTAAPSAAAPTRAPDDFDRPSPSPEAGAAGGSNGSGGIGRELLTGLLVLLGALGLAALPRAARSWVRRRRWASATTPAGVAEAAWAEVRASALDLGLGWDDSVTLRTRARSLAAAFGAPAADAEERQTRSPASGVEAAPEAARALERLVRYVERARYARAVEAQDGVEDDVLLVVGALGDGASRRRRLRATWWPTSLFDRSSSRDARRRRAASGPAIGEPGVDHAV